MAPAAKVESEQTFAQLVRAAADKPDDPDTAAQLALAYLNRESYAKARRQAEAALKLKPKQPLAGYVMARLYLEFGEGRKAYEILQDSLDEQAPHPKVLELLAAMKLRLKDVAGAEKLFLLARKANPQESKWLKALRKLYFKTGQTEKLTPLLEEIAENDADDFESRKALAQISLNAGDLPAARLWANQANEVNVMDAEIHRVLGEASLAAKQPKQAAEEFEYAIRLNGKDPAVRLSLVKAFRAAKQDKQAKTALEDLLRRWPDHAEAKRLMKELK